MPPTPEGPAVAVACRVTGWFTHTLGLGSFGVLKDAVTGSLSTWRVSEGALSTPAAFVAASVSDSGPLVPT
jgi:hypothetical protein